MESYVESNDKKKKHGRKKPEDRTNIDFRAVRAWDIAT